MSVNAEPDNRSPFLAFFGKPAVGIVGVIVSIIGVALSVYFFLAARERPELTYFVHPAKAAVVRTGQTSRLSVQFDGKELTTDVTAAQIAFWNAGTKPIHANAVLSPLVIRTGSRAKILTVRLRKTSRDVAGITLDTSRLDAGQVEIGWRILEQNDGGALQIVYAGDEIVAIEANAVLEGQPSLVEFKYAGKPLSPGGEYTGRRPWWAVLLPWIVIGMGATVILISVLRFHLRGTLGRRIRPYDWVMLIQGVVVIAIGVWGLIIASPPWPPFGF